MFDDVTRELRRLERGMTVSVPLPSDEDGYDEKECPNPECLARFRIHTDDWSNLVTDEQAFCPVCRHEANSQSWFTPEQVEHAQAVALRQIKGQLDQAFSRSARRSQTRPSSGMLAITFSYRPGRTPYLAPLSAGEVLEQRSSCEACGCRYASIGAAFFCPACGHNSATSTFADTLATVRASLDLLPKLTDLVGRDAATDLSRGIAENGLVKLVTAFQRFAEATYDHLPDPKPAPAFNAFQRLGDGSELFRTATGRAYGDVLGAVELASLGCYVQQRHSLVHRDGIVDDQYLAKSGDTSYRFGQRLVIGVAAVRDAAELIERLARGLA